MNNNQHNRFVSHPLQSFQWGKFRERTGARVIRINGLQVTIHKIPHTSWTIGYMPKGPLPDQKMLSELYKIGKQNKCIFIQLEPNAERIKNYELGMKNLGLRSSFRPLFTKYTFILDLTRSEEELLKNMNPKTRYNIRISQKHEVKVLEDNSDEAFEEYLKLTKETTKRQGFYAHSEEYHRLMWETLKTQNSYGKLTAHLFLAKYKGETLAAWILFVFKDTLYYPYGASSSLHRGTMASNLMMWEAIKFGKKLGLKKFDMWGALGPNPDKSDSWYGFHRFKEGYGGELVEFVGSYDLVLKKKLYFLYKVLDSIRWRFLRWEKWIR